MAVVVKTQRNEDMKGIGHNEKLNICIDSPSLYRTNTEVESPASKNDKHQGDHLYPNALFQGQNSFIEEVIGIITIEDVIEELLQVTYYFDTLNPAIQINRYKCKCLCYCRKKSWMRLMNMLMFTTSKAMHIDFSLIFHDVKQLNDSLFSGSKSICYQCENRR